MTVQYSNAPTYQVYNSAAAQQSNPAMQQSLNSVGSITETIKADRSIRMWKMEALKVNWTSLLGVGKSRTWREQSWSSMLCMLWRIYVIKDYCLVCKANKTLWKTEFQVV